MKRIFFKFLCLFSVLFISINIATAQTYSLRKSPEIVSVVLQPYWKESLDFVEFYGVSFTIQWGAYQKSFEKFKRSNQPVIYRFTDVDGAGYDINITPHNGTRVLEVIQGASLSELRNRYPYATILTCDRTEEC